MATSYTSNKKIGALDAASTPLAATNEIVINQNGDILKTPLSAVEAKVFDAKTQTTTPSGTEVTIVRQTDGSLRQVPLANIVPALNITNAQISSSAAIEDTKLATINTAGKVTNNAVQAVSTNTANRVVARDGSGNFAAGTVTATLSGNASTATILQTGRTIAMTGDVTYTSPSFDGSANVTAASTIANNAVTTAKIADSNVTTAKIADSNVTTAKIADSNVTTAKIADSAVTSAKIADGAIATADLADGAVTSAKIADGTIVNGDIANTTITDAKLATISTAGKVANSATTATSANTGNAIVARDASGNFTAGTMTGDVTGNAGTVTNGLYTNAVQNVTGTKSFIAGNSGMASVTGGLNTLEVYGTGGAAMMTFHRPGAYAVYFGIDSDNVLKVGGWSLGNAAHRVVTTNDTGTVSAGMIADDAVTAPKLAPIAFNTQAASYTVTAADAGTVILMNSASANTVSLPAGLPIGTQVTVIQIGTGQTSFAATGGAVLRTTDSFTKLYKQWSVASAIYVSVNNWVLAGDIIS